MRLRVLVACEFSGVVRRAFSGLGHDAYSCDLIGAEDLSRFHIKDDVLKHLDEDWDLMIAHPPCTHLAVSGSHLFKEKVTDGRQQKALDFVQALLEAPIPHIALENPVSIISTRIRKPDQIIEPWMFGHGRIKKTCLWLKELPTLRATKISRGRISDVMSEKYTTHRAINRSRTYEGIAHAFATQWAPYVERRITCSLSSPSSQSSPSSSGESHV